MYVDVSAAVAAAAAAAAATAAAAAAAATTVAPVKEFEQFWNIFEELQNLEMFKIVNYLLIK